MKALDLLKKNTSTDDRAQNYIAPIKRNLQISILDVLIANQEKISDQILDLQDFNLATDVNAGVKQLTREECEARFKKIIDLKTEYELQDRILDIKQSLFNEYFGGEDTVI